MAEPLRIGILGAARIAPMALIRPAQRVPGAVVAAVAARDAEKARRFAAKHGIARVHPSYEALLADPDLDAVYNPLPNSLHATWTIRALEAGKHVLCEKPFSATVAEAEAMAAAATAARRILMEAFHYRYHPLFARVRALIDAREIGTVERVEAHFHVPIVFPGDIRWRLDLAGGALMDAGCYAVHLVRHLAGAEPTVLKAAAAWTRGGVDREMQAEFRFPDGRTGGLSCALLSPRILWAEAVVIGSGGRLRIINPIAPQFWHRVTIETPALRRHERVRDGASYEHQLRAFVGAVRDGDPFPTTPADAIANMRVIEATYAAAGRPRA